MTNKESRVVREQVGEIVAGAVKYEGYEFVGFTKEGAAFSNGEDNFVIRVIVKSEETDILALVEEKTKAVQKALDKQKEKEEKAK